MKSRSNALILFGQKVTEASSVEDPRWRVFTQILKQANFFKKQDNLSVFVDFRLTVGNIYSLLSSVNRKRILVQVEPRTVNPLQFSPLIEKLFDEIVSDRAHASYSTAKRLWVPGYDLTPKAPVNPKKSIQLGTLASNKFSAVVGSQYHLRIRVLEAAQSLGVRSDLAGKGWAASPLENAIRAVIELLRALISGAPLRSFLLREILKESELALRATPRESALDYWRSVDCALVVENEEGVLSEKIFDAVSAGCRVIYVGSQLPTSPYILSFKNEAELDLKSVVCFLREPSAGSVFDSGLGAEKLVRSLAPTTEEGFFNLFEIIMEVKGS